MVFQDGVGHRMSSITAATSRVLRTAIEELLFGPSPIVAAPLRHWHRCAPRPFSTDGVADESIIIDR